MTEAESSLLRAEERSSEAMLTAEAAVHDEMEAFTVAKEIQSAFSKALNDLNALNAVFEANTNATKSKEQAQAERDTMVRILLTFQLQRSCCLFAAPMQCCGLLNGSSRRDA